MTRLSGVPRVAAIVAVVAVLIALVVALKPQADKKYVTVDFPRTVSLYEGSEVKILGVPVGEVETVTPRGETVQVKLWYDAKYQVPADAKAVIISPSIVADRYVQLTPAYTGGAEMADGTHLDDSDVGVPVELDEIYQSLDDLSLALGPNGANQQGALSDLIDVQAENFDGQGAQFRQTLHDLSLFTGTLSNNKEELFASLQQVDTFVHALRVNDGAVRSFNTSLAGVSTVLAGERQDLAATLKALGGALADVQSFVLENRDVLKQNISGLADVTRVLVNQREALKEVLDVAPVALANLTYTYNPVTGTLDNRSNVGENINALTNDPLAFLCGIIEQGAPTNCDVIKDIFKKLPKLPKLPRSSPFGLDPNAPKVAQVEHRATSLEGLLGVRR